MQPRERAPGEQVTVKTVELLPYGSGDDLYQCFTNTHRLGTHAHTRQYIGAYHHAGLGVVSNNTLNAWAQSTHYTHTQTLKYLFRDEGWGRGKACDVSLWLTATGFCCNTEIKGYQILQRTIFYNYLYKET